MKEPKNSKNSKNRKKGNNQTPHPPLGQLLASVLTLILSAVPANASKGTQSEYYVTKDYPLRIDLMDMFSGNNLEFQLYVEPENACKFTNTSKVIKNSSFVFDKTKITKNGENTKILFLRQKYPKVLGLTRTEEYAPSPTNPGQEILIGTSYNVFFYYFDSGQNEYIFGAQQPLRPPEDVDIINAITEVYDIEHLTERDKFLVDLTFHNSTVARDALAFSTDEITPNSVQYKLSPVRPWKTDQEPTKRTITQKIISVFSNVLFRASQFNGDQNTSILVEATSVLDSALNSNQILAYKPIKSFSRGSELTNIALYSDNVFIGLTTKIVRLQLNNTDLAVLKTREIDKITSKSIALVVKEHVDLISVQQGNTVDYIRWDDFDVPLKLNPQHYGNPGTNISKIIYSYEFTVFVSSESLIVQRVGDVQIYQTIKTGDISKIEAIHFNPDNGLMYAELDDQGGTVVQLRSFSKTVMAIFSDYEVTDKPLDVTVMATSWTKIAPPGYGDGVSTRKSFQIKFLDASTKLLNTLSVQDEESYLNEVLTTESYYKKQVPDTWFLGNNLTYAASCDAPGVDIDIITEESLSPKLINLQSQGMSSKTVFYYEIYSQPLDDGSFVLVSQIELNIYFQKCVVSIENILKCRTFSKISERNMITKGILVRDQYFVYRTNQDFIFCQFSADDGQVTTQRFLSPRAICVYQILQSEDYLYCVDYEKRVFHLFYLDKGLIEFMSFSGFYANEIKISTHYRSLAFLNGDQEISIVSVETAAVVNSISSDVTKQLDSTFKICGRVLITFSIASNQFEEYDITDINDIVLIKRVDLQDYNLYLQADSRLGFHLGCTDELPLVLNDGKNVKAVVLRVGEIVPNFVKNSFVLGPLNYYANYFVEGLDLRSTSVDNKRIIWSYLDTSNTKAGHFGSEVASFKNPQIILNFQNVTGKESVQCTLTVSAPSADGLGAPRTQKKAKIGKNSVLLKNENENKNGTNLGQDKVELTFSVKLSTDKTALSVKNYTGKSEVTKTQKVDVFQASETFTMKQLFSGEGLIYNIRELEEDFNTNVKLYSLVEDCAEISRIMKCSRESTQVKDVLVAGSGSIYTLTNQTVYKIKNGTTYAVNNFMSISSAGSDGFNCHKLMIYFSKTIMVSLCDKSQIPYLVISNWNSLKPSNAYEGQLDFEDIELIDFSFMADKVIYVIGSPNDQLVRSSTKFEKYVLGQDAQKGIVINKVYSEEMPSIFQKVDIVTYTENGDEDNPVNSNYFVAVTGVLNSINSSRLVVYRDGGATLDQKLNLSFAELLKDYPNVMNTFSTINDVKCLVNEGKPPKNGNVNYNFNFSCLVKQIKNFHFEFEFVVSNDEKDITVDFEVGYKGYGDFLAIGEASIHKNYTAILVSRPTWRAPDNDGDNRVALAKSYVLLYSRSRGQKNCSLIGGIPVPMMDANRTILRLVSIRDRNFIFIAGYRFYSMVALEIKLNNSLEIFKDIVTKNLTVNALNHYSKAQLNLELVDETMTYFLIIVGIIVGLIVVLGLFVFWKKKRKEDDKKSTFDEIAGMMALDYVEGIEGGLGVVEGDGGGEGVREEDPDEISDLFNSKISGEDVFYSRERSKGIVGVGGDDDRIGEEDEVEGK